MAQDVDNGPKNEVQKIDMIRKAEKYGWTERIQKVARTFRIRGYGVKIESERTTTITEKK